MEEQGQPWQNNKEKMSENATAGAWQTHNNLEKIIPKDYVLFVTKYSPIYIYIYFIIKDIIAMLYVWGWVL